MEYKKLLSQLLLSIKDLELDAKISALNEIRTALHFHSPFVGEPVDLVLWVDAETVEANGYNPNSVARPEMELLKISIEADGYTQPIVTWTENERREVIDGYHRHLVGKNDKDIQKRIHGYLPVVTANSNRTDKGDRIAATIRHNRARGKHRIDAMSEIVVDLKKRNWSDAKISKELGMDSDEVLRLCQISGLAEMFEDKEFSQAWEAEVIGNDESIDIIYEDDTLQS